MRRRKRRRRYWVQCRLPYGDGGLGGDDAVLRSVVDVCSCWTTWRVGNGVGVVDLESILLDLRGLE